ncbi:unnamed protein product [Vicia faba]|uniref:Peptidase A1 domain-containing protein n=1 Tax=Vicia faba TaxID=3906 RepID=A0AAV1AR69_VICFA|nr:unnamed protein product [Vicia faba]
MSRTMSHFSLFIFIFICLSCLVVISHAKNNGFSVELIHRDSFKSPLYNPTQTKFQRNFNVVRRSINRANYFYKELSSTKNKLESYMPFDYGEYLMSYSVGTPPFQVYGILDTASNLNWLQCKPYYGNGIDTHGDLSEETLTLDSAFGSFVSFPKIVIGCGHNNGEPTYNGPNSGVIGFGSGDTSLIKQLGSSIGGKFSYCLIDEHNSKSNRSSKLNFGDDAIVTGDNVVSTPIVKMIGNRQKDHYYLTMKAFSVGNKRIKYRGFKREGTNASTHNIIIDSGTNVCILPHRVYYKMESAMKKVVKLPRFQDDTDAFRLCYNTTSKQNFPPITAHFKGADVKLDSKGAFYSLYKGVECFAFIPYKNGLGLFGNMAQVNYLVGYDLNKNIVSFKSSDCTNY